MSGGALDWHRVARVDDVTADTPLGIEVGDRRIGLYLLDGEIFALDDICTHQYALLSNGYVEGGCIECPLHQARFEIRSGKCLGPPAEGDVAAIPVRIEAGEVYVALPTAG